VREDYNIGLFGVLDMQEILAAVAELTALLAVRLAANRFVDIGAGPDRERDGQEVLAKVFPTLINREVEPGGQRSRICRPRWCAGTARIAR
jgi:hypothetical protein